MYQGEQYEELYPSFWLLDGAKRLTESIISSGGFEDDVWPHLFVEKCEEGFDLLMTDQEAFVEFISDSTRMLAIEMKKRSGQEVLAYGNRGD
jgi:hypothetical protein